MGDPQIKTEFSVGAVISPLINTLIFNLVHAFTALFYDVKIDFIGEFVWEELKEELEIENCFPYGKQIKLVFTVDEKPMKLVRKYQPKIEAYRDDILHYSFHYEKNEPVFTIHKVCSNQINMPLQLLHYIPLSTKIIYDRASIS